MHRSALKTRLKLTINIKQICNINILIQLFTYIVTLNMLIMVKYNDIFHYILTNTDYVAITMSLTRTKNECIRKVQIKIII